jgi:DegV family protein with EDD domain
MVTIVADTTCSIPGDVLSKLGIPLLPQIIIFGDDQYRDDTEINNEVFLQKLRASSSIPKTAAPSPSLYIPIYKAELEKGNSIVVITPSSDISGTFRGASVAAEDFPGADIRIIDSRSIAGALGSMVMEAHKLAQTGASPDEVEALVKDLASRQRVYALVDTLEYLYKGGRIGGASALFGSLLQVKPILALKNGRVESHETQRTKKRALARVIEIIEQECPHDPSCLLTLSQCENMAEANQIADACTAMTGMKEIPIYETAPSFVVHAGPKVILVSFFVK